MSPRLPFDTLYSIFSFLPVQGELYREDRRLYDSVEALGLPVPLTNTKDIASCAWVCRAWNAPALRHLLRDIRVINHAHCVYLISLTSDPIIGRDVHTLEFISGTRRPDTQTLKADITQRDVVALVKNCPRLRTFTLFGCRLSNENLEELICDASLDEIITLGLSRQASVLTLRTIKRLLDRMPKLRAFSCPALKGDSGDLPPAPTTKLQALITHQDSLFSFWLLSSSVDTLETFDPEFHTQESLADVKMALNLTGHHIQRLSVPAAAFVSELLPLCPKLRHLEFPALEMDLMPLLACIVASLESLTLFSDRYLGRGKAKATLSDLDTLSLIEAIKKNTKLQTLKLLDLCLTYHKNAYPRTPVAAFEELRIVCALKGIQFPCPDISRLRSGPPGDIPKLLSEQSVDGSWPSPPLADD